MTSGNESNEIKTNGGNLTPIFASEGDNEDFGELFRDKVRAIFEHFDTDQDEHLKFAELAALQKATAGSMLTEDMYVMACRALDCQPNKGISLDALKLTYAAEGSDIEKDYYTVFPEGMVNKDEKKSKLKKKEKGTDDNDEEEEVHEIGADGTVDISS